VIHRWSLSDRARHGHGQVVRADATLAIRGQADPDRRERQRPRTGSGAAAVLAQGSCLETSGHGLDDSPTLPQKSRKGVR
jgi:hypothetical protein